MISKVPARGLMNPEAIVKENALYAAALRAQQAIHERQSERLKALAVDDGLDRVSEGHDAQTSFRRRLCL